MVKVVYNTMGRGLLISRECIEKYMMKKKRKGEVSEYRISRSDKYWKVKTDNSVFYSNTIPRHDIDLVECVEELGALGSAALGSGNMRSRLYIAEIDCDKYIITKHMLHESIETENTLDWISVTD